MADHLLRSQEVVATRRVACTYQKCQQRFVSTEEMQRHKKQAPEHDYCKKCDVDCADWEELLQHKVSVMDDFFRHRHSLGPDAKCAHITFEFCGEDFKSFGGRRGHRDQMHPADQEIRCSGCEALFTRAGNFVAHLEGGDCPEISAYEFRASIIHKHLLKEIFKDPGEFNARMEACRVDLGLPGSSITDGTEGEEPEEGGVGLLDEEHAEQKTGYHALEPDVENSFARPVCETWPRLPGLQIPELSRAMRSMSITANASSVNGSEAAASDVTSRRGGLKVLTESTRSDPWPSLVSTISVASPTSESSHSRPWPYVNSPTSNASVASHGEDDTISSPGSDTTTVNYPTTKKPTAAWTGSTTKTLFKPTRPNPPASTPSTTLLTRPRQYLQPQPQQASNNSTNFLYLRFYDPSSPDYLPTRFYNPRLSTFCCPFPACDPEECQYDSLSDLELHFQHWHLSPRFVCPMCLKRFGSAGAQVAHMEGAVRCRVKEGKDYRLVLDEITGGFLKATRVEEPLIYQVQQALVVAGRKARNGVMKVEYQAKLPGEP
ncbi:hypothetical protein LTR91_010101 [Friedmanniomyces endolithicus]|uniref:C2H2-type domain-containing protein n=1 Tax=Friedmanniomyces endolithicus TaxID=329885 RepID=A0AAN6KJQ2_9PEZI|nr:hypothetical protein LTR57_001813 [Friedmanniomyces endolithicus]KAK0986717.1 hypothetical protein LTR91_010101 [Friedmanniomyces endolithicus]KAK1004179.1 hypothetical protein LTS01_003776 [Friedmanniomyces endolithicus]KAK1032800.1 hypothetical protein LTS16_016863 [Friedmanniomyces endolithicus]